MEYIQKFKNYLFSVKPTPSKITVKNYSLDVKHFIAWFESKTKNPFNPSTVSLDDIASFRTDTTSGLSIRSLDRHVSSLRKFFHFLKLQGIIPTSPFENQTSSAEALAKADPYRIKEFKDFLYVYNASNLTIKNYIIDVKQFLKWAQAQGEELSTQLIAQYRDELIAEKAFSASSINRKLSSLRKYMAWATSQNIIKNENGLQGSPNEVANIPSTALPSVPNSSQLPVFSSQLAASETTYSPFPPFRLAQKISKGINFAFESVFIAPLAQLALQGHKLIWTIKGKPLFHGAKKISAVKNISKRLMWYQKLYFHTRYTRPNWYKRYHSYALAHYFNWAILMIVMTIIGFGFYNSFVNKPQNGQHLLAAAQPNRILSFQGRLTDNNNNPITTNTNLRFAIYNDATATGSALQWQEVDNVTPDANGVFSVLLGKSSGIPQSLFANNANLYLGITVGQTPELTPRQQLATVAYATNAETLQGLPPITQSGAGTSNVVLALNSSGNLSIGAASTFQTVGGAFTLSGDSLVLNTNTGTNGNVAIAPDGQGFIDLQKPLINSTNNNNIASAQGSVEVDDTLAILATSSGVSAVTINQNGSAPILSASSGGVAKFTIGNAGDITASHYNTAGGIFFADANGLFTQTTAGSSGQCLTSAGGAQPTWGTCGGGSGTNFWTLANGALYPVNTTLDAFIGGTSTTSANFSFLNNAPGSGTPTASVSSGLNGSGTFITANGTLQTTNFQGLTIGGASTGNITLNPLNGTGTVTIASLTTGIVHSNGSGVLSSSAVNLANGDVTGILPLSHGGTGANITGDQGGLVYFNSSTTLTTLAHAATAGQCLISGGTGAPSWTSCSAASSNWWNVNNGALYPINDTFDLLLGGSGATTSAKFAVLNMTGSGTPTASVSSGLNGSGTFITATGTLQTTNNQGLTLGGTSTGSISFANNINSNIIPSFTDTYNLGSSSLEWNNLYVKNIVSTGTISGFWQRNLGVLAPSNITDDLAIGGVSTSTAKFQVFGNTGNATTAGTLTFTSGGSQIQTTSNQPLTLGGNTTGNIILSPNNNTGTVTINGSSLVTSATIIPTSTSINLGSSANYFGSAYVTNLFGSINSQYLGFFQRNSGVLSPTNITDDIAVGGTATSSAKFQVFGNTGNATTSGNLTFNGNAVIAARNNTGLTIGDNQTGNITVFGLGTGVVHATAGLLSTGFVNLTTDVTGVLPIANGGTNTNTIGSAGSIAYSNGSAYAFSSVGSSGQCLVSNGSGTPNWTSCSSAAGATNYWTLDNGNGVLYPINTTLDAFIGGTATNSAHFAFLNNAPGSGTPTASVSSGLNGTATYITANGTIQTTNNQGLTIGGASTGNITLSPQNGNGSVTVNGTSLNSAGSTFNLVTNATALSIGANSGTTTVNNALTATGTLTGNGNVILGANNTKTITANGEFNSDLIPAATDTYNLGSAALEWNNLYVKNIITSGNTAGFWQRNLGVLAPANITDDLAIGGTSTNSALFQIFGNTGNATTAGTLTFTNGGSQIQTTSNQTLTLGGNTTGGITLTPNNGSGIITLNGNVVQTGSNTFTTGTGLTTTGGSLTVNGATITIGNGSASTITTSSNANLTLNAGSGNIQFFSASNTLTSSGNLTLSGTITLPNSNTLTGIANALQLTNGLTVNSAGASATHTNIDTSGNVLPGTDGGANLGSASLEWNNVFAKNLFLPSTGGYGGYWQLNAGTLSPANITNDIAVGGTSTSSAKFQIFGLTGNATTAGTLTFTGTGSQIQTTNDRTLTLGGNSTGNISFASNTASDFLPFTTDTYNLGSSALEWNTIYVKNIVSSGSLSGFWQRNLGALSPANITDDVLVGGTATNSAKFQVFGLTGNATTAGTLTFTNGGSQIQTTSNQGLTIGGNSTGNITLAPLNGNGTVTVNGTSLLSSGASFNLFTNTTSLSVGNSGGTTTVLGAATVNGNTTLGTNASNTITANAEFNSSLIPSANNTYDLGTNTLAWRNLFLSGNYDGFWQRFNGAVAPYNLTDDLLLGSTATTSAKFAVLNMTGAGNPTASVSSGLSGTGMYFDSTGELQTVRDETLTLGGNTTGNISFGSHVASSIFPYTTNTYDLGSAALQWNNIYAHNIFQDGQPITQVWQRNLGTVEPLNITDDVLAGGTSTTSAKFAVLNMTGSSTPTASVSSGLNGTGTYITANGTLQTTSFQGLTIGGATTGNITLAPLNNSGTVTDTGNLTENGTTFTIGNGSNATITTAGTNSSLSFLSLGTGNITLGQNAGLGNVQVIPNAGGNAALVVNKQNTIGDIFTASSSGTTKFLITNGGTSLFGSGVTDANALAQSGITVYQNGLGNAVESVTQLGSGDIFTASNSAATKFTIQNDGTLIAPKYATDKGVLYLNGTTGTIAETAQGGSNTVLHGNASGIPTFSAVDLTADVSNILPLTHGGTGANITGDQGGIVYFDSNTTLHSLAHASTVGQCLLSGGTSAPSWSNCGSASSNWWNMNAGTLFPINQTFDLTLGSSDGTGSSASAKFAVLNMTGSGTPTASVSSGLNGSGTFITANGTLQTTNNQGLTIGGPSTGNITLAPLNSGTGAVLNLNAATIDNSQLTTTIFPTPTHITLAGAATTLTIGNSGGTTTFASNIDDSKATLTLFATPTTINEGATGQTVNFAGNVNLGTNTSQTFTANALVQGAGVNNAFQPVGNGVTDLGSATHYWGTVYAANFIAPTGGGTSGFWQLTNSVLSPVNFWNDLSVGGNATGSATPFQVFATSIASRGITAGSATTSGSLTFFGSTPTINTTNMLPLTVGGSTTGSIQLSPKGTTGLYVDGTGNVGIGTTNPAANLDINGNVQLTGSNRQLQIGTTGNSLLYFGSSSNNIELISNQLAFNTNQSQGFTFTGGNVGIGTTGPVNKLDINGALAIGTYAGTNTAPSNGLIVSGNVGIGTTSSGVPLTVVRPDNSSNAIASFYPQNLTESVNIGFNQIFEGGSNGNNSLWLDAQSGGSVDLASQVSTNVGIGVTNPSARLEVNGAESTDGSSTFEQKIFDTTSATTGVGGGLALAGYYSGTSSQAIYAIINGIKENSTAGNYASALTFQTRLNGGGLTEQMRITSAGNVAIGTTAASDFKLEVLGNVGPQATDIYNLGSSALEWNNLYVRQIISPSSGGIAGFWQLNNGAIAPTNLSNDILAGGVSTASATFHVYGASNFQGTSPVASISAHTSFAGLVIDNTIGDLFTASVSGITKFVLNSSGHLGLGSGLTNPQGILDIASSGSLFPSDLTLGQTTSTNWVANPSFEYSGNQTNTWTFNRTPEFAASNPATESALFGSYALRMDSSRDAGSTFTATSQCISVLPNNTYTESAYVYVKSGFAGNIGMNFQTFTNRNCTGAASTVSRVNTTTTNQWSRISSTTTLGATVAGVEVQWIADSSSTGIAYLDGVQLEKSSSASPYIDGSLGSGYSWDSTGAPNATDSSRLAGAAFAYQTINSAAGLGAASRGTAPTLQLDQDGSGPLFIASVSGTNKFIIANNGNVGIGTTAPVAPLEVAGSIYASSFVDRDAPSYFIDPAAAGTAGAFNGNVGIGTTAPDQLLELSHSGTTDLHIDDTAGQQVWVQANAGAGSFNNITLSGDSTIIYGGQSIGTANGLVIAPWQNATSGIRMDANGNVGIGTTNPSTAKLVINNGAGGQGLDLSSSDTYANLRVIQNTHNGVSGDNDMYLGFQSGTTSSLHLYSNNAETLTVKGGNVGIGSTSPGALLDMVENANTSSGGLRIGDVGNGQSIRIWDDGTIGRISGNSSDSLSIAINGGGTGNVGIGTTGPNQTLEVDGGNNRQIRVKNTSAGSGWELGVETANNVMDIYSVSNSCGGSFWNDNSTLPVARCSDQRVKTDITSLPTNVGLEGIRQLNPVSFKWNLSGDDGSTHWGLIAQQVQQIYPYLVTNEGDQTKTLADGTTTTFHNFLTVDYNSLIFPALIAIQQLDASNSANLASIQGLQSFELAQTGNISMNDTQPSADFTVPHYFTLNDAVGNPISRMGAYVELVVGNLRVGSVNAQQIFTNSLAIATDNVSIAGQRLSDYIVSVVNNAINNGSIAISSPIASIDQIHTNLISPLASDSAIAIDLTGSKFTIRNNASGSAVATIDNTGNATFSGTLNSQNLAVNGDATVSGTLHAGNIEANNIIGLNEIVSTLSAQNITNVNNIYFATPSAAPNGENFAMGQSGFSSTNSAVLTPYLGYTNLASYSGFLAYVPNLSADTASLGDTTVTGQLSVGAQLILADNSINVLGDTFQIQPLRQGGVSFEGGLLAIDTDGNLTVNGNAVFSQTLAANIISPISNDRNLNLQLGQNSTATGAALATSNLSVQNASGSGIFSIDQLGNVIASGAATIGKLNLHVAQPALAVSDTEQIATGSAGTAFVKAHQTEITIDNKLVTNNSLIYITPVGSGSVTPYLLRQVGNTSFTVGIPTQQLSNTTFNWLIVN